jgi:site-specific DNA-methyltransferase (cytosine-N4-specific)
VERSLSIGKFPPGLLLSLPGSETGVEVLDSKRMLKNHREFLKRANLYDLAENKTWTVLGSNAAVNYSTHGIFRYFGKFPAPIARQLILEYSKPGGLVIDPACGSGTTGVEALWLQNEAQLYDINPLSVLVARVKITPISAKRLETAASELQKHLKSRRTYNFETDEIDLNHWFLPETIKGLAKIKSAISLEDNVEIKRFQEMVFASVVRKVSKATTQQGRLFLDVDSAVEDPVPLFLKALAKSAERISQLPKTTKVRVARENLLSNENALKQKANLVIYHPPYFNAYKYSSINSLELAWLEHERKEIRRSEIREFFKVGKPENAQHYVDDMTKSILNIEKFMNGSSRLAVMIGDALMKNQHLPVTRQILDKVSSVFEVERTVVRVPKYTEASWATSQRRNTADLGVTMYDFIITLRKK